MLLTLRSPPSLRSAASRTSFSASSNADVIADDEGDVRGIEIRP